MLRCSVTVVVALAVGNADVYIIGTRIKTILLSTIIDPQSHTMPPNDRLLLEDNESSCQEHRSRWIHRRYLKDSRLRVTERYKRSFDRHHCQLFNHSKDDILIVPQANILRRYMNLIHRLHDERNHIVVLESSIEYLDWRNQIGAERAVSFERQRLQSIWKEPHSYLLDLSWEWSHDEWDLLKYDQMTETERCRHSYMRTVEWLSRTSAANIWIVTDEDDETARYDLHDMPRAVYKSMKEVIESLYQDEDVEPWMELLRQCQAEYEKRKSPASPELIELSDDEIQTGLQSGTLLRGRWNVSKDNVQEGYVSVGDVTYFIDKQYVQHAFHQDIVAIQVLPEHKWGRPVGRRRLVHHRDDDDNDNAGDSSGEPVPSARIVAVDAIGRRMFVATLLDTPNHDDSAVIVVPMDVRIPKIRIRTRSWNRFVGQRIKVQIMDWEPESKYPHGQCLSVLGEIGDLETEIKALLIENQVELEPFTVPALSCLPVQGAHWRVSKEDLANRRDLRTSRRIFSVDPPGTSLVHDFMFWVPAHVAVVYRVSRY